MDELSWRAALCPQEVAACDERSGEKITNLRLHERSIRLGAHLIKEGLRPGDCIGILINNVVRALEVEWATSRAGIERVSIDADNVYQVASILVDGRARALLVESKYRGDIEKYLSSHSSNVNVFYVDGTAAREIADGYEWIVCYGEIDACQQVLERARGVAT